MRLQRYEDFWRYARENEKKHRKSQKKSKKGNSTREEKPERNEEKEERKRASGGGTHRTTRGRNRHGMPGKGRKKTPEGLARAKEIIMFLKF